MSEGLLEIGAVARELGVAPSTLRTWERRYQTVVPHRGSRGERLYDSDQVVTLRRVLTEIRRGVRAHAAHDLAGAPHPTRTARVRLAPSPEAPLLARKTVDELLDDRSPKPFAFHLRLVANELVKNAVLYGSRRDPITLQLELYDDCAQMRVQNAGGRLSITRLRERRRNGGRGLDIVDALAESWSIDTGPFGTKVTVKVPIEDLTSPAGPEWHTEAA
jgi:DNA-binding transcriptional MerR regulator